MAWRFHGHARVNPSAPSAFGVCARCQFLYNLDDLIFQYDWRGPRLQNLYFRVCKPCCDKPQEQLRPIILPPDPVPRYFPQVENYAAEDAGGGAYVPPVTPSTTFTLDDSELGGPDVLA